MARRRSNNRRFSRRSMNVTELDDDSELIDTANPMWWKNIEDDITVRQSRRSSHAETTSNILDTDSRVDLSELDDEWWKKLDKTDPGSRRISTRQSLKSAETPTESFTSDNTDNVSIKKRKVLLRARPNKSGATDNFARALIDSDGTAHSEPTPGKKHKSKNNAKSDTDNARKKLREIPNQSDSNSLEVNDEDKSINTSNDTEVIVKTRPKPFKKRFQDLPNNVFDDILKSASQTSQIDDSPTTKSRTKSRTSFSNKSLAGLDGSFEKNTPTKSQSRLANKSLARPDEMTKTPITFGDSAQSQLMGPPKTSSHHKRLSSISRKLNLTSDESGSDSGLRKTRPGFAKKHSKNLSINPFDEILSGHLETSREIEDPRTKKLSFETGTGNEVGIDKEIDGEKNYSKSGKFRGSREEINHRSKSLIKENPGNSIKLLELGKRRNSMRKSFVENSSRSQIIEEIRENEVKTYTSKLSKSLGRGSVERKTLDVSLTRIPPLIPESQRIDEEETENEEAIENLSIRSLRSMSQSRIADSAYDLPDQERTATPIITASESENEIEIPASTSRKINARGNLSRTKIFSDEDMSMEDLNDARERNVILRQSPARERQSRGKKSFAGANKSGKRSQVDENISKEAEADKMGKTLSNSQLEKKSRKSKKSFASTNKSQEKNLTNESEDDEGSPEKMDPESSNFQDENKSHRSEKRFAVANKSQKSVRLNESSSEDNAENVKKTGPTSTHSILGEKSHTARKSVTFVDKSQKRIESDKSISENEESISENEEITNSKSSNFQLKEKTGTSSEIIRPKNKNRRRIESDETIINSKAENVEKSKLKSSISHREKKSLTYKKSLASENKSRQSIDSGESISEDEVEDAEKSNLRPSNSRLDNKSRTSPKSLTSANKSQKNIESDESISEDEVEDAEKSNLRPSNSRPGNKSGTSANKSQKYIESDESISEDELENAEKTNPKSSNSHLVNKSRTPKKSLASVNKSGQIPSEKNINKGKAKSTRQSLSISSRKGESEKNVTDVSQETFEFEERFADADDDENQNSKTERNAKKSTELSKNSSTTRKSTNHKESSISARKNDKNDYPTTIPWEKVEVTQKNIPSKKPTNKGVASLANKSSVFQSQKSITEFFPSKFLEKSGSLPIRENVTNFDKEKLALIKKKMDRMKRQKTEKIDTIAKTQRTQVPNRAGNFSKTKNSQTKENTPAKKTKVIDKAYIVNGTVYKRPKLPRPKPWVTDRLYRHLWKFMEPKYKLATRVKSEKFVQQLCEIVALTIRRKKYESYKLEVDVLMKEMARLGIIKTRNDFYDFCYDFLPYEFRVKATPILLPGNMSTIPYDPEKLYTPILDSP